MGGFKAVRSVKQFVLMEINLVCFSCRTSPSLERSPEGKPPPLCRRWTRFPDLPSFPLTFSFHIAAEEVSKRAVRLSAREGFQTPGNLFPGGPRNTGALNNLNSLSAEKKKEKSQGEEVG